MGVSDRKRKSRNKHRQRKERPIKVTKTIDNPKSGISDSNESSMANSTNSDIGGLYTSISSSSDNMDGNLVGNGTDLNNSVLLPVSSALHEVRNTMFDPHSTPISTGARRTM